MFGHLKKNYALSLSYLISTVLSLILASEHSIRAASCKAGSLKKYFHSFCSSLWVGLLFVFGTEALQAFMNENVERGRKEQKAQDLSSADDAASADSADITE